MEATGNVFIEEDGVSTGDVLRISNIAVADLKIFNSSDGTGVWITSLADWLADGDADNGVFLSGWNLPGGHTIEQFFASDGAFTF
jgi:hypothetical protein